MVYSVDFGTMADTVLVQIPGSREAPAALSDEQRRAKIGKL
jgi:hypothetical protein